MKYILSPRYIPQAQAIFIVYPSSCHNTDTVFLVYNDQCKLFILVLANHCARPITTCDASMNGTCTNSFRMNVKNYIVIFLFMNSPIPPPTKKICNHQIIQKIVKIPLSKRSRFLVKKNPAYGRHQLSQPMRIVEPIQI